MKFTDSCFPAFVVILGCSSRGKGWSEKTILGHFAVSDTGEDLILSVKSTSWYPGKPAHILSARIQFHTLC